MAIITKRNKAYRIKVSCGYDCNGKQVVQSMTWTPRENMTEKQIQKELNRQAVLFEEACMKGLVTSAVKFEKFTKQWDEEYAKPRYKKVTYDKTSHVLKRLNQEIGHMRLDKITTRNVQTLIDDLIYSGTLLYKTDDEYISNEMTLQATHLALSVVDLVCNDNQYKRNTFIVAWVAAIASILSLITSVLFGLLGLLNL